MNPLLHFFITWIGGFCIGFVVGALVEKRKQ